MDYKRIFFLFKQGNHFCSVPWNHIEIFTNGGVRTCIEGKWFGNLLEEDLEDILKKKWIVDLKETVYNDQPHDNCTACYNLSTGKEHTHLRNHYNSLFQSEKIDYSDFSFFNLRGIDLHWDNTCNLKCVYCSPASSSAIAQEQKVTFKKPKDDRLDQVVELILKNQWNLKELYLSGGEPMLIKHNLNLLGRLENFDLPIRINSNITHARPGFPFFEQIKKFRNVLWTISAEATEERFEYIRHGSSWPIFLENLDHIRQGGHKIRINAVWFVGSAVSMFDALKLFIDQYGITDITINQLEKHSELLVRNLPNEVKDRARINIQNLLESGSIARGSNTYYNILRCNRELDLSVEDPVGYKNYFDSIDQRRGLNWRKIFTELDK